MSFIIAHEALIAGFAVALLDFAFGVSKGLESNGILHFVYLQLKSLAGK